eukprot:8537080-Lingulodinium_polyedra.AAC.1
MLFNSLKRVIVASVPFSQRERHSNLRGSYLLSHTRTDEENAHALGMVKGLARKVSKAGHQILSIPSSPGYQFVAQEYANLKPRSGLGPRGLRRCKQ